MTDSLFLRRVFQIDAPTCFAFFVLLTFGAQSLAGLTALDARLLTVAGIYLLPCAVLFLFIGTRRQPPVVFMMLGIISNLAWVAKSIGVMAIYSATITPLGVGFVSVQAAGVLGLALLEAYGLRKMRASA